MKKTDQEQGLHLLGLVTVPDSPDSALPLTTNPRLLMGAIQKHPETQINPCLVGAGKKIFAWAKEEQSRSL